MNYEEALRSVFVKFENSEDVLQQFLNSCISARKTIDIWPKVYDDDSKLGYGFNLQSSNNMIDFIANSKIIAFCKPEILGYGKKKAKLPVYGYKFVFKQDDDIIGYFAVVKLPPNKNKIKWQIKSLHKDIEGLENIAGYIGDGQKILNVNEGC